MYEVNIKNCCKNVHYSLMNKSHYLGAGHLLVIIGSQTNTLALDDMISKGIDLDIFDIYCLIYSCKSILYK